MLAAIVIAGTVPQSAQGGYIYFGAIGASSRLMPPMFATANSADFASRWVCPEKHYGLAQTFGMTTDSKSARLLSLSLLRRSRQSPLTALSHSCPNRAIVTLPA